MFDNFCSFLLLEVDQKFNDLPLTFFKGDIKTSKQTNFECCPHFKIFRQHAASIYGFVRSFVSQCVKKKKLCVHIVTHVSSSPPKTVRAYCNTC